MIGDIIVILVIAAVAGGIGLGFGIFFVAPRLSRLAERKEEEPRDGDD